MPTTIKTKPSATNLDKHIGNRVRTARIASGISQSSLAKGLGISFQQVQKYERGANRISASRLLKISETLNVSITYLYYGHSEKNPKQSAPLIDEALMQQDVQKLVNSYISIKDPSVKKSFLTMLSNLSNKSM